MRFWDSSALVTLHVEQKASQTTLSLYRRDSHVVAWILSDVEIRSALCRLGREGLLAPADQQEAVSRIDSFWRTVHVVSLFDSVKSRAKRLLGVHSLCAADALQLGAALAFAHDEPTGYEFVCLDLRLCNAARQEGFTILP